MFFILKTRGVVIFPKYLRNQMSTSVIQNSQRRLGDLLRSELIGADKFCAASAFLNSDGLDIVLPDIRAILDGEGEVSIVHGADFRITDPFAIERLVALSERHVRMTYKVHLGWDLTQSHRFHPKLYFWTSDYRSYTAVVGSSNLTYGGLFSNTEVNAIVRGVVGESPVSECLGIFEGLIAHPSLVTPNHGFVEKYTELYERAAEFPVEPYPPSDLQELYRELEELNTPRNVDWQPNTQLEFVVKALQNLQSRASDTNTIRDPGENFVHLSAIYKEFEAVARAAGKSYKWETGHNSVRRVFNEDIPKGTVVGQLFVRESIRSGRYRLSDAGLRFGSTNL